MLALFVFALASSAPRAGSATQPVDHVELDAIVTDDSGAIVEGLPDDAFAVKEDGARMTIDAVDEIGSRDHAAPRLIVVVLDDSGVRPQLTARVQQIARMLATRVAPDDRITVMQLSHRGDEAVGDQALALSRIADYRAGMIPFFGRETLETALQRVRTISRGLEQPDGRRKSIVAIGSPGTFDVREPVEGRNSLIWPYWSGAVAAASRANVNVSVIDPTGVTGRLRVRSDYGLVQTTGGDTLYNSAAYDEAVARIRRDAGHYYMIGYAPTRTSRELHDIEVTVNRPGLHVRARTKRG